MTDPEMLDFYDEEVVKLIFLKYGMPVEKAFPAFLNSRTYRMLADSKMGMEQFGPPGVFDMWECEQVTGSPLNSAYLRMV